MPSPAYTILEAPSTLGLVSRGVERLPQALLDAGLAARIGASHAGRVEPPLRDAKRDPATGVLNAASIVHYAIDLADALAPLLGGGAFPVVLGGDCSIALGCLLATRRRGRSGLLFIDGHADFYQPEAEPNGEAASMDLAFATGHGPPVVTTIGGYSPLVREDDVVLYARRDAADAEEHGSRRVEETGIHLIDLAAVHAAGVDESMARALDVLAAPPRDGFWIHLDADVLDDAVMPAVDYRMPGGLSLEELSTVLCLAVASGRAVGLDVAIFNPSLDPSGNIAQAFADALVAGLSPHGTR